jgi:putative transcriptional regulator
MRCTLTNRLAECLAAKKLKKSQLAYCLRMSRAYITRLVRGDVRPSLEAAIRIARFFHKPVEEIFQLEEAKPAVEPTAHLEVGALPHVNFPGVPPSASGEQSITTENQTKER